MLTEPIPADESLDTTGLYCPIPVIKTAEKMKGLPVGTVLEVISDDGGIEADHSLLDAPRPHRQAPRTCSPSVQ